MPTALRLQGALDVAALEAALGDLVARHESLRTLFPDTGGVPRQHIVDAGGGAAAAAGGDGQRAGRSSGRVSAAAARGFDLVSELPLRAHAVRGWRRTITCCCWCCTTSPATAGRSSRWRGISATPTRPAAEGAVPELPPLPVQYADYTLWQHGRSATSATPTARSRVSWRSGLPHWLALPDQLALPTRPAAAGGARAIAATPCRSRSGRSCTRAWCALAREGQASLFMVLQAGFAALLTRLGAGTDIPIGSPIAGRTDSALDDLVGFFVNTLVLRTDTSGDPSFRDLIARVRAANLAAYSHQDLPFERLVEVLNPVRSLARHPLFQVMLVLQHTADAGFALSGLQASDHPVHTQSAKFDLSLDLVEWRAGDGTPMAITGQVEYATDLFDRATIEALAARLVRLLEAVVGDPERAIGRLDILSADERDTLLREWNDTAHPVPPATVPELFGAQVTRSPAATALVCGDACLTYAELEARANRLAHHLRRLGVGPEVVVGLCLERSFDMVIALLAILKAGGAYLPLDPDYPQQRLAFMLADTGTPLIVTHSSQLGRLPANEARIVCLDAEAAAIARHPAIRSRQPPPSPQHRLRHLHLRLHRTAKRRSRCASKPGQSLLRADAGLSRRPGARSLAIASHRLR